MTATTDTDTKRRCPKCRETMSEIRGGCNTAAHRHQQLVIDYCPWCDCMWFPDDDCRWQHMVGGDW